MVSTFYPDCTFPDHQVNYVGAPPLRSTMSIVWPCVLTLITSIYTALHLDVIADQAATSATPCGCKWCRRLWNRVCRSVKSLSVGLSVAAVSLFAPEMIALRAIAEWNECSDFLRTIELAKDIESEIKPQWTKTHAYYLKMGGLRLRCLGPFSGHGSSPCDCMEITLNKDCLIIAMICGLLPQEPPVTSQEISDHSKASAFAKVIAIWQIGYFLTDLATRLARRLPITQLEIGVSAIAMIAIVTLCAYFNKPKGVGIGTRVYFQPQPGLDAHRQQTEPDCSEQTPDSPQEREKRNYIRALGDALGSQDISLGLRSQSFHRELRSQISIERKDDFYMLMAVSEILMLAFGAVHVAAWNSNFQSVVDLWLWRISSLVSMVILLLGTGIAALLKSY